MSIFTNDPFEGTSSLKEVNPAILIGLILVICVLLFAVFQGLFSVFNSSNEFKIEDKASTISEQESSELDSSNSGNQTISIHILGAVVNPGMYQLPVDSRVNDAVLAAGGLTEEAEVKMLNLARILQDGEQIYVFSKGESREEGNVSSNSYNNSNSSNDSASVNQNSKNASGLININSATQNELEKLPGIGSATAKKILDYRTSNGNFSSVKDITKVSGVGEKKFEQIKGLICI